MNEMESIIQEFLVESLENLEEVDRDLVGLEREPENSEKLDRIFRAIHTIKGTCGFLDYSILESVAHSGENLLSRLRAGELLLSSEMTSLLLQLADAIRSILHRIEKSGTDKGKKFDKLQKELNRAASAETQDPKAAPPNPDHDSKEPRIALDPPEDATPEGATESLKKTTKAPTKKTKIPDSKPKPAGPSSLNDTFVRVDVRVLDRLMNLVGELVLTRNQLLRRETTDTVESSAIQQLNHITGELQAGIMQTRMQPVSKVLGRFPRMVRDLAASCGKSTRLSIQGQETELDRSLIEAIRDPLTHLVRNCVDHGIEDPSKRQKLQKEKEGRIWIRAFHEGGQVSLEVEDDGRGINPEEIRRMAIEKKILSPESAAALSRDECLRLLFRPGFSTSKRVSNISGRGVGLDVVRSNIERVNGMIDIESRPGLGTVFRLRIPLTLAIMPAIVLRCAEQRYAIPQSSVLELVRWTEGSDRHKIEKIHGASVLRLRGRLLPLVSLRGELQVEEGDETNTRSILVLQAGDRQFGLIIDDVEDTQEIVVKPLSSPLDKIPIYAGATIMGDGRVALILDTFGLAQRAHVITDASESRKSDDKVHALQDLREGFLIFKSPGDGRMAIPLAPLIRLEKLEAERVERLGDSMAIQYRDDILALVPVLDLLPERRKKVRTVDSSDGTLNIAVYESGGKQVGLLIGPVVDIVEEEIEIRKPASRKGVAECLVVQDRVTELLDVEFLARKAALPLTSIASEEPAS